MSEPQLERSVLEAKQKEELRTIAKAVGEDLPANARKGELVDAILRAAGVDVPPAPEAPRRSRARKATAKTAAVNAAPASSAGSDGAPGAGSPAGSEPAAGLGTAAPGAGGESASPAPAGDSSVASPTSERTGIATGGNGSTSEEAPLAGQLPFEPTGARSSAQGSGAVAASDPAVSAGAAPAPAGVGETGSEAVSSGPAGVGSEPTGSEPVGQEPAGSQAAGSESPAPQPAGSQVARSQAAGSQVAGSQVAGSSRTGGPLRSSRSRGGFVASPDGGTSGMVPPGTNRPPRPSPGAQRGGGEPQRGESPRTESQRGEPQRNGGEPQRGGGEPRRGGNGQADTRPVPPAPQPAGANAAADRAASADRGGSPDRGGSGDRGGNTDGDARPRVEGEAGNRRNRRRRGRDRGERNVERDLVNQNNDAPYAGEPLPASGYLDLRDEGYGFLRTEGYLASPSDVYVSISQVRRFQLRKGDWLEGGARPAGATEKYPALLRIDSVGGLSPEDARSRPAFDELTAVTPTDALPLEREDDPSALSSRLVDLFAPLGRGQRALVAGPPRSGKSGVLAEIVNSVAAAHPELQLFVVVIDERPEEVTELRRAVRTDVVATTFDQSPEDHVQVTELVIERAKRLVEAGTEVMVVFDGLTRLARAYNQVPSGSSRVLPGGIDPASLQRPLGVFGAGRNIENGGSLTLLATALVETGSRLDDVIFEELAAAANMTLLLDRDLAKRGVRPAIDFDGSWCRNEDRLVGGGTLEQVQALRLLTSASGSGLGAEELIERLGATKSNREFLAEVVPGLTRSDGQRKRGGKAEALKETRG